MAQIPQEAALTNALILSSIFELMDLKDKANFRLVGRLWRDSTLNQWRKILPVVMSEVRDVGEEIRVKDIVAKLKRTSRKSKIYNLEKFPFRSYVIQYAHFTLPPPPGDKRNNVLATKSFFETCGQPAKSMKFKDSVKFLQDQFAIDGFKWILLKTFPNLKELCVFGYRTGAERGAGGAYGLKEDGKDLAVAPRRTATQLETLDLWAFNWFSSNRKFDEEVQIGKEILSLVPNLKNLKLHGSSLALAAALKYPKEDGKFIQLEKLYLDFWAYYDSHEEVPLQVFTPALLDYIRIARPPITNLSFHVERSYNRNPGLLERSLRLLVTELAPRLTTLKLLLPSLFVDAGGDGMVAHLSSIDFPKLTHLTVISSGIEFGPSCPKVDFRRMLRRMPNLQVFRCRSRTSAFVNRNGAGEIEVWIPNDVFVSDLNLDAAENNRLPIEMKALNEFSFYADQRLSVEDLRILANWLPSVTKMTLVLDEITFPRVLEFFPKLERLTLLHSRSVEKEMISRGYEANEKVRVNEIKITDHIESSLYFDFCYL